MATTEMICSGFGGQGVLVMGLILANAAMEQDRNILWYPSYGTEMRGGTANCTLKISDEEIASPKAEELDILFAMNEASLKKFEGTVKPGGHIFVNSSVVTSGKKYRSDVNIHMIPATDIANGLGNPRGANIVIIGALGKATDIFDYDYLREAIDRFFLKKGKVNPKNALCFDKGAEYVTAGN